MELLRPFAILALTLAAPFAAWGQTSCTKQLTLAAIDWPPYSIWDKEGETPAGLDIELTKAIVEQSGCTFKLVELPFKRALRAVEFGNIDGVLSVSHTMERDTFGHYSIPLRQEVIGAFVSASMPQEKRPKSFAALATSDHKIGIVLGGWYGLEFERAMQDASFRARVQSIEDFETLFRSLGAGLIDVAVNDVAGGRYIAEKTVRDGTFQLLPFPVNVDGVHILLSKASGTTESDIQAINRAIDTLQTNGISQQIQERYLPLALLDRIAQPKQQ